MIVCSLWVYDTVFPQWIGIISDWTFISIVCNVNMYMLIFYYFIGGILIFVTYKHCESLIGF